MEAKLQSVDSDSLILQLEEHGIDIEEMPANMFNRVTAYFDSPEFDVEMKCAESILRFANGKLAESIDSDKITHIIIGKNRSRVDEIRLLISKRQVVPRVVTLDWITESWKEQTVMDAERFALL
jgi:DNA ligase-4